MTTPSMTSAELHARVQTGESIELIDVRTPVEFRAAHIQGARNAPLHTLDSRALSPQAPSPQAPNPQAPSPSGTPVCLICRTGVRASEAYATLTAEGRDNLFVLEGGVAAWEQAGLPLERGAAAVSLERQVRIAAGSLVLLGTSLGFLVAPGFYVLAAFVGAGLLFAGITDTCGMAMLLARMPWNR